MIVSGSRLSESNLLRYAASVCACGKSLMESKPVSGPSFRSKPVCCCCVARRGEAAFVQAALRVEMPEEHHHERRELRMFQAANFRTCARLVENCRRNFSEQKSAKQWFMPWSDKRQLCEWKKIVPLFQRGLETAPKLLIVHVRGGPSCSTHLLKLAGEFTVQRLVGPECRQHFRRMICFWRTRGENSRLSAGSSVVQTTFTFIFFNKPCVVNAGVASFHSPFSGFRGGFFVQQIRDAVIAL